MTALVLMDIKGNRFKKSIVWEIVSPLKNHFSEVLAELCRKTDLGRAGSCRAVEGVI
jgi:hypothetical protein